MQLGPDRSSESESPFSDVESEDLPQVNFERNMRYQRLSSSRWRHPKPEHRHCGTDPSYRTENAEPSFRRGAPWVSDESDPNYTTSPVEHGYSSGTMIADTNGRRYWSASPFAPSEFSSRSAVVRINEG